jgi:LacI family transcriptional regulator, galactose operon repressor
MNLEEVARLAGVSRSTVSRVVNDDPRVSEDVRARVQQIIREHNYHPNAAARSLASRRTRILGLVFPKVTTTVFSDPFFPKLIQGAVEACNAADHNLMMLMDSSAEYIAGDRIYNRIIRGHHLDGVVIASSVVDDPIVEQLQQAGFPFVLVGRHPRYQEVNSVDVDNRAAAQSAVSHLIEHGYRRIAVIAGMRNMIATIDRYAGYVTALQEAGQLPDPALMAHGDFSQEGGYAAMQQLLPHNPDAVFVASDVMAFGALRALEERGLRVPEDIALIGFDGQEQTAHSRPPLSTVGQPIADLGREAVHILLDRIEHPDGAPRHHFLPTHLILRRSCGCTEAPPPLVAVGTGAAGGVLPPVHP